MCFLFESIKRAYVFVHMESEDWSSAGGKEGHSTGRV